MNKELLIVEDDPGLQKQLKWALKSDYNISFANNRGEAEHLFAQMQPAVVIHDLGLPPDERGVSEGKASVKQMLQLANKTRVIVMTGQGDEQDAIELVGFGAHDFLTKPVEIDSLKLIIDRAFFLYSLETGGSHAHSPGHVPDPVVLPGVVGSCDAMQRVADRVRKIAKTSASVFIHGQSGTGKELIAKAIHNLSERREKPFVAINCAAIPESLLESELFGYEKGAFTGAAKRTIGKIEQARQGTLFLDEIGDMNYQLQSKILRFLQERVLNRVGGSEDIAVDVRVISATHQDIKGMIDDNGFREDLYYRINEIQVDLPPLSERGDDVVLISNHILRRFADLHGKSGLVFSRDALELLRNRKWKGNVRELSNQINKAVILSDKKQLQASDFDFELDTKGQDRVGLTQGGDFEEIPTLKEAREQTELNLVVKALAANNNNVNQTAKKLGVSRQHVYELIRKHNVEI